MVWAYPDTAPGVRPFSGAASLDQTSRLEHFDAAWLATIAAPEDGRTPAQPDRAGAVSGCARLVLVLPLYSKAVAQIDKRGTRRCGGNNFALCAETSIT